MNKLTVTRSPSANKITILNGAPVIPGVDGKTPYIKDGYWWIGETNTNVRAEYDDAILKVDDLPTADIKTHVFYKCNDKLFCRVGDKWVELYTNFFDFVLRKEYVEANKTITKDITELKEADTAKGVTLSAHGGTLSVHTEKISDLEQADIKMGEDIAKSNTTANEAKNVANTAATTANNASAQVTAETNRAVAEETAIKAKVNANESAINKLNGTGEGSVHKTVAEAIAELVAGAPESLDNLKEIADWLASHSTDAGEMNSKIERNIEDIDALESLIGNLPNGIASTTVIEYIREAADAKDATLASTLMAEINANAKAIKEHKDAYDAKVAELTKTDSDNSTAISNEVLRAKAAESANATAISNEIARAKKAEEDNASAIANNAQAIANNASDIASHILAYTEKVLSLDLKDQSLTETLNTFMARVNALLDSEDTTLDELQEIVDYIKNNKTLIDGITTSKVSVRDIIDNLVSEATNKPLSANQGRVLKELIDALDKILTAHKATYDAKVVELESADSNNATAISNEVARATDKEAIIAQNLADHIAIYNAKVEELEKADTENADSISANTQDIAEHTERIQENKDGITEAKNDIKSINDTKIPIITELASNAINTANKAATDVVSENARAIESERQIGERVDTVESIAKGANKSLTFANYATMIATLNSANNVGFGVGQNILIVTLNVPDLWVSEVVALPSVYTYTTDEAFTEKLKADGTVQVGYYKVSALETQKVNLTDYATKGEVKAVDDKLVNYVKNTDLATSEKAGLVKVYDSPSYWIQPFYTDADGMLALGNDEDIIKQKSSDNAVRNKDIDIAVKAGITDNQYTLTDEEKTKACGFIGAVKPTDYAESTKGGVVKVSSGNTAAALYRNNNGQLLLGNSTDKILARDNTTSHGGNAIRNQDLDYAVMASLTDPKTHTWTPEQKGLAQKTLGIGEWITASEFNEIYILESGVYEYYIVIYSSSGHTHYSNNFVYDKGVFADNGLGAASVAEHTIHINKSTGFNCDAGSLLVQIEVDRARILFQPNSGLAVVFKARKIREI